MRRQPIPLVDVDVAPRDTLCIRCARDGDVIPDTLLLARPAEEGVVTRDALGRLLESDGAADGAELETAADWCPPRVAEGRILVGRRGRSDG